MGLRMAAFPHGGLFTVSCWCSVLTQSPESFQSEKKTMKRVLRGGGGRAGGEVEGERKLWGDDLRL